MIAAGGGGIPVIQQGTRLKGASAVIEKDYTAAKLADMLEASCLLILTGSEQISAGDKPIGEITSAEALSLIEEGHFDPITTLPKIDASVSFVTSGENRTAVIGKLEQAADAVKGKCGTIIRR